MKVKKDYEMLLVSQYCAEQEKKKRIIIATTICTMLSINGRAFLQVLIINLMVAYLLCKDPRYTFRYL